MTTTTNDMAGKDVETGQRDQASVMTTSRSMRAIVVSAVAAGFCLLGAGMAAAILTPLLTAPATIILKDVAATRTTFFSEVSMVQTFEAGGNESEAAYDLTWNASFTAFAFNEFDTGLHHSLLQESGSKDGASHFSLRRESGPGVLYVENDASEGMRWHITWQVGNQLVHRTHVGNFIYTFVTDHHSPSDGLVASSWTHLEKRHCNIELRSDEYMMPTMAMPQTVSDVLKEAGAGTLRQTMGDVRIDAMSVQKAPEGTFLGCVVNGANPVSLADLDLVDEADEPQLDMDAVLQALAMGSPGGGAADEEEASSGDQLLPSERLEAGTPLEIQVQLWPSKTHSCASYEFLNPIVCDVLSPPTAVLEAARREAESGTPVPTVGQSEFIQYLVDGAAASAVFKERLFSNGDAADPAYLGNLLTTLDVDGNGILDPVELGLKPGTFTDADALAEVPKDGARIDGVVHGRRQFGSIIAKGVAAAIAAAARAAAAAAAAAARAAAARAASRAAHAASAGWRLTSATTSRMSTAARSALNRMRDGERQRLGMVKDLHAELILMALEKATSGSR